MVPTRWPYTSLVTAIVRLPSASLIGRQVIEFTFVFKDDGKWQGTDYRIAIRH